MKKRNLVLIGTLTTLLLVGCGASTGNNTEAELQQQITQLEQKIEELEQQAQPPAGDAAAASGEGTQTDAPDPQAPSDVTEAASSSQAYTMEELTSMVDSFQEKVSAAAPGESRDENLEQFFALKQEENQIDDALDLHEDELEREYRNGNLTRDEYKSLERELEKLEDRLDDAEDQLEYAFGIDD